MNKAYVAPAALVLVLGVVVVLLRCNNSQRPQGARVEPLVAMPEAISISSDSKRLLDRALIYFVVSGYLKAASSLTPTNKVQPRYDKVVQVARSNVSAILRQKLEPFKPAAREGWMETARKLMRRVEAHIQSNHARGAGGSISSMSKLVAELQQLSSSFNTGVRT